MSIKTTTERFNQGMAIATVGKTRKGAVSVEITLGKDCYGNAQWVHAKRKSPTHNWVVNQSHVFGSSTYHVEHHRTTVSEIVSKYVTGE